MEGCPGLSAIQSQNHCAGALGRAMEGGREGERERFGLKPFWLKPFGLKFGSSWNCLDLEKGIGFSLPAIADLKSTGNPSS